MNRIAIAALAAIMLLASGCSWAFSRPPHRAQRANAYAHGVGAPPLCGPHYVAPVIDLSQAAGGGILTLYALGHASDDGSESAADTLLLIAAITGGVSALFGASAHHGFEHARACRELRSELASGGVPARGSARVPVHVPPPAWIAPSVPAEDGITIEQDVDVDEEQIEIRTRIRPGAPPPAPR